MPLSEADRRPVYPLAQQSAEKAQQHSSEQLELRSRELKDHLKHLREELSSSFAKEAKGQSDAITQLARKQELSTDSLQAGASELRRSIQEQFRRQVGVNWSFWSIKRPRMHRYWRRCAAPARSKPSSCRASARARRSSARRDEAFLRMWKSVNQQTGASRKSCSMRWRRSRKSPPQQIRASKAWRRSRSSRGSWWRAA
eukprot:s2267_g3.t4